MRKAGLTEVEKLSQVPRVGNWHITMNIQFIHVQSLPLTILTQERLARVYTKLQENICLSQRTHGRPNKITEGQLFGGRNRVKSGIVHRF